MLASRNAFAEPPVDRISTPRSASTRANATRPDLSETEISARLIGTMSDIYTHKFGDTHGFGFTVWDTPNQTPRGSGCRDRGSPPREAGGPYRAQGTPNNSS